MTTLNELLQDADPLQHEPLAPQTRVASREALLASLDARAYPAAPSRSHIAVLAAIAAVLLLAVLLGARLWSPQINDVRAAVRFEVRLAEENPGSGLRAAQVVGSGRTVYLHNEVVVTNGDIASARAVPDPAPPRFRVDIQFTPSGTDKMRAATAGHIGKPLALLLDGRVVMALTLRSVISNAAVITGNFSKQTVERIAVGITPN